jgi:dihydrolipoamide dehydrogenase
MADFDVIIIGGGPGGYVAAIRCAQLGLKTACIEDRLDENGQPSLGGTCLNIGCIPSKALLDTSHHYFRAKHEFSDHGIKTTGLKIDVATMMQRKQNVVQTLTGGVAMLFAKHKVTWLKGRGALVSTSSKNPRVQFVAHDKKSKPTEYESKSIILATGSSSVELETAPFDGKRIVDSTGALDFKEVPKRLGIIGGGVIGLELGSVWSRLGTKVSTLVRGDTFLRNVDQQLSKAMKKNLEEQGMSILMGG